VRYPVANPLERGHVAGDRRVAASASVDADPSSPEVEAGAVDLGRRAEPELEERRLGPKRLAVDRAVQDDGCEATDRKTGGS